MRRLSSYFFVQNGVAVSLSAGHISTLRASLRAPIANEGPRPCHLEKTPGDDDATPTSRCYLLALYRLFHVAAILYVFTA